MTETDKILAWLDRLREGVANQNNDAERVAATAMNGADLVEALELAKRMIDEALPKFDWGKSCLDADAIRLLNEAPIAVNAALAKAYGESE